MKSVFLLQNCVEKYLSVEIVIYHILHVIKGVTNNYNIQML